MLKMLNGLLMFSKTQKTIAIAIGIFIIVSSIVSIIVLYRFYKKRYYFHEKIKHLPSFGYNKDQDIFYTKVNAWQRIFGYSKLYDDSAKHAGIIIDTERVYFVYKKKVWLIQFWKGQYGLATGAEIGIYYSNRYKTKEKNYGKLKFKAAKYSDMLPISLRLYKGERTICWLSQIHWWVGGFKLGEYSQPHELTMVSKITFTEIGMRNQFVSALRKNNFGALVAVADDVVTFTFSKPSKQQGERHYSTYEKERQKQNFEICKAFSCVAEHENTLQKLEKFGGGKRIVKKIAPFSTSIGLFSGKFKPPKTETER